MVIGGGIDLVLTVDLYNYFGNFLEDSRKTSWGRSLFPNLDRIAFGLVAAIYVPPSLATLLGTLEFQGSGLFPMYAPLPKTLSHQTHFPHSSLLTCYPLSSTGTTTNNSGCFPVCRKKGKALVTHWPKGPWCFLDSHVSGSSLFCLGRSKQYLLLISLSPYLYF